MTDDEPIFTIETGVYDVSDKMLMSRSVGKGSIGDEEFEVLIAMPALSPVIRFRGKEYMVMAPELANQIVMRIVHGQPE